MQFLQSSYSTNFFNTKKTSFNIQCLLFFLHYLFPQCRFHSLHHTQFRTNYSLFMPMYDYIYGTMDKSSDSVYKASLKRTEEYPEVVHLTHLTTPDSIYHLRVGFPYLASKPQSSKWYFWLMWPLTCWSMLLTWVHGRAFVVERNLFKKHRMQTLVIPRYSVQVRIINHVSTIPNHFFFVKSILNH